MLPEADTGFWKQIFEWAWTVAVAMAGVIWRTLNGKIEKMETKLDLTLPKGDFRDYTERAEQNRKELRDAVIDIYSKQDETTKLLSKIAGKLGID
jgi:ribonuclease HIII